MSSSKQQAREKERVKRLIEESQSLPETLRHALLNRLNESQDTSSSVNSTLGVSRVLSSLKKAPAEVLDKVTQKVEEIRDERVEQVKIEVKKLLDSIDLQKEVIKLLTQVSIDLKTTIRLVPDHESTVGIKPQVKTHAKLKWGDNVETSEATDDDEPYLKGD